MSKEYIPRETAIDSVKAEMKYRNGTLDYNAGLLRATENLEILPAADVVEVRHGKWVWDENGMDWGLGAWKCSECHLKPETWWETYKGNPYRYAGSSYCNNCGAKMK